MQYISRTDGRTLPEQSLADRFDGEEFVEPKVVDVHSTDKRSQHRKLCCYIAELISLMSIQYYNCNSRTDGRTLLDQSLTDRSDGEQSVEPKVVGVHLTDKPAQPRKLCTYI